MALDLNADIYYAPATGDISMTCFVILAVAFAVVAIAAIHKLRKISK